MGLHHNRNLRDTNFTGGDIAKYYDQIVQAPIWDRIPTGVKVGALALVLVVAVFGFGIGHRIY